MSRQPYDRRSSVSEKQRIIRRQVAERLGQEFRPDGLDPRTFIDIVLQKTMERVRFLDVLLEKALVGFLLHELEQCSYRRLDIADQAKVNTCAAPNMLRVLVNLGFFHFVPGEEL